MRENGVDSPFFFFIEASVLSLAWDILKSVEEKNASKGVVLSRRLLY